MNNRRRGMTMVELLVYMAILSVVILLFGKQVTSLINQYTAGKSTTKQQIEARNVVSTLVSEIQNMGLKVYLTAGGSPAMATGVTVSATDLSSFVHKQGTPSDTLTIYKAELDAQDKWNNIVDTIRYYISGTSLTREFKATGSAMTSGVLAENVYALQFSYGTNVDNTLVLNQTVLTSASWPTFTNVSGTAPTKTTTTNSITLAFSGTDTGYIQYQTSLSVTANQKYQVNLSILPSGSFPGNLNWLCFSFRKTTDNSVIGSEKFLPQKTGNQVTVSIKSSETVYPTIEYGAKGSGTITINGVDATRIETGSYAWNTNPTAAVDKQNVRIIQVQLLTRSDNKTGVKTGGSVTVGDAIVATNDNYTWRLSNDIIETPSNNSSYAGAPSHTGMKLTDIGIRSSLISVQY